MVCLGLILWKLILQFCPEKTMEVPNACFRSIRSYAKRLPALRVDHRVGDSEIILSCREQQKTRLQSFTDWRPPINHCLSGFLRPIISFRKQPNFKTLPMLEATSCGDD